MTEMQHTGYALLFGAGMLAYCTYAAHDMRAGLIRDVCGVFMVMCGIGAYGTLAV